MQKTMITAATMFAILVSAGASMAGPLNGNGFSGKAHDVRSTVSQAFDHQTTNFSDRSFDAPSKTDLGQAKSSLTQQTGTYGSSPSSQLPNVVYIPIQDNGSYTWVIGKSDDMIGEYSWMLGRFGLDAR